MQPNFLLEKSEAAIMMEKYGEDYGNTLGGVSSAVEFANGTTSSQNKVVGANKSSLKTSSSSMFRSHNNNNVFFYTFSLVIFLFAFSFDMHAVTGSLLCSSCRGGVCPGPEPTDCRYGTTTDFCGRRICAKGPGQICGVGMFKMIGSCGDGMYCSCGKCTGCSLLTYECFDETCPGNGNSNGNTGGNGYFGRR